MPRLFARLVKRVLQNPIATRFDLEDPDHIRAHFEILQSNPVMRAAYERWYAECVPAYRETAQVPGLLVELGSGVGYLERFIPGLIRTDSIPSPYSERVVDAMKMDFPSASLRAIFAIAVFHHLSSPSKFLAEAERCLAPGGQLVLVDASNTFPQKFLCRLLDHYEYFDDTQVEWENPTAQKLKGANLAMAWMVFVRDAEKFQKLFPKLKVKSIRHHTFLSYILSGGMSYRPFVPAILIPFIDLFEWMMIPFGKWLSTGITITLDKQV